MSVGETLTPTQESAQAVLEQLSALRAQTVIRFESSITARRDQGKIRLRSDSIELSKALTSIVEGKTLEELGQGATETVRKSAVIIAALQGMLVAETLGSDGAQMKYTEAERARAEEPSEDHFRNRFRRSNHTVGHPMGLTEQLTQLAQNLHIGLNPVGRSNPYG